MVKEKCCSIRRAAYWFLFILNQNINPDLTCDMSDVYPVSCEHLNQLRKSWMTRFGVTNALLCVAERNAGMLNHKGYGKFLTIFLSHWNLWRIDYTDRAQIRLPHVLAHTLVPTLTINGTPWWYMHIHENECSVIYLHLELGTHIGYICILESCIRHQLRIWHTAVNKTKYIWITSPFSLSIIYIQPNVFPFMDSSISPLCVHLYQQCFVFQMCYNPLMANP